MTVTSYIYNHDSELEMSALLVKYLIYSGPLYNFKETDIALNLEINVNASVKIAEQTCLLANIVCHRDASLQDIS